MADQKISQLPTITGANMADNDKFVLVDTSGDATVATTRAEFFKSVPSLTTTGTLSINKTSGYGAVEIGGPSGGLIDLKAPASDDYDARIIYNNANSLQIITLADEPILLRHAGTTRLSTTSTGIGVTGNATFADNGKAIFGAGSDLEIFHQSSNGNSIIRETGSGVLSLQTNGSEASFYDSANGNNMARFITGAEVQLFHNGDPKFSTTATGIDVTGTVSISDSGSNALNVAGTSILGTVSIYDSGTNAIVAANAGHDLELRGRAGQAVNVFSNGTATATFANNGKVGIGTSLPSGKTHSVAANNQVAVMAGGDVSDPLYPAFGFDGQIGSNGGRGAGMYLPADGNLAFSTAGSEAMRIDPDGNVGIGTDDPSSKMHIVGATSAERTLIIEDTFGNDVQIQASVSGGNASMVFKTEDSEAMRIDSDGNVGISQPNPDALLHVGDASNSLGTTLGNTLSNLTLHSDTSNVDSLLFTTRRTANGTTWTTAAHRIQRKVDASIMGYMEFGHNTSSLITFGEANTEYARIDGSGNVLVGTTTSIPAGSSQNVTGIAMQADGQLHVSADGQFAGVFNRKTSDGDIVQFRKDGTTVGSIGTFAGDLTIGEDDVGIRFDTGSGLIPWDLGANSTGGVATNGAIDLGANSARFKDLYLSGNANVERVITTHDGDWGMEMKGITSARLRFHTSAGGSGQVGAITVSTSATTYATSSDYRLKENVVDLTGASARVNQLNPSRFNFISDDTNTLVDGFLAHEVATVVPEAITGTKDAMMDEEYEVTPAVLDDDGNEVTPAVMGTRSVPDYQGIDQSKLVPLLTAALQEALTKIDAMETRLTALEG